MPPTQPNHANVDQGVSGTIGKRVVSPRPQDLRAFWGFYEPRGEAIVDRVFTRVLERPQWRPVWGDRSSFVAQQRRVLDLLRDALIGERWQPYLEYIRGCGKAFAHHGIDHQAWFELIAVYRDLLRDEADRFAESAADRRAARQINGGISFLLDTIRRTLIDAYIEAKEEVLVRSEQKYRSMFDRSPLPMWMYERETLRIVAVNDAAIRQYGYSRKEFLALTIADLRAGDDLPELHAAVREARGFAAPRLWRHRTKDGSEITVEITAHDFDLVDGKSVRLVLAQDVTERECAKDTLEKTQAQLRHAQKMEAVGRLAGGVAHDMNNILTAMRGYAALLEEDLDGDDPRRADAAEIRRASERAEAITRQLLALSRHSIARPRPVELAPLIEEFLPMLGRLLGDQIQINTHLRQLPAIVADPHQIEQVLMNLAVNARDAMPEGGRLIVETQLVELDEESSPMRGLAPGEYVAIVVTDTGTGMDAETRDRIFEPFYTTKDEGKGTGLGLSIVHGIVAQAGGSVRVYSEPGHGSTFRVYLPVAAQAVSGEREKATASAPPRELGPLTVLVVDDDRAIRGVVRRVLTAAGCKVLEAATAEEARRVCVEHVNGLDAVVLDVVLPDGRGDRLVEQLRELRPGVGVVLVSGYPTGALSPQGGVPTDLLAKPFTPGELRQAVAAAVGPGTSPVGGVRASSESSSRSLPRVLLVDDDDRLRRLLSRVLVRDGFAVVEAASGQAAAEELERGAFDVVLTDVHMPGGGGLELIREVRRVDLDVPVILITGNPDLETAAQAVEYGAFRYLSKPIAHELLCRTVQHAARAHSLAKLRREAFLISGVDPGAVDRAGLEVRFEQAFEGLWIAYQPIVEARSGTLFAAEALVRSRERSMSNPPALLDAAHQLDRLPQLGRRVRELAAADLAASPDEQVHLFVNLHPSDLLDAELVNESAPLSRLAHRVVLEVTERSALEESDRMRERIARLRELGFRLAVDDIGAGYSGLKAFTDLAPEWVKIDMSLVRNVDRSARRQQTIAALCRLCHDSGSLVVGEGVETIDERDILVELGCDLLQGYLIGRPDAFLPRRSQLS